MVARYLQKNLQTTTPYREVLVSKECHRAKTINIDSQATRQSQQCAISKCWVRSADGQVSSQAMTMPVYVSRKSFWQWEMKLLTVYWGKVQLELTHISAAKTARKILTCYTAIQAANVSRLP